MGDWRGAGRTWGTTPTFSHESDPQNHDFLKNNKMHTRNLQLKLHVQINV